MPGRRVGDCMTRDVVCLRESDRLRRAVEVVVLERKRHVPVLDGSGSLVGILTDRDLRRVLPSPLAAEASSYGALVDSITVGRAMSRDPLTVEPDMEVAEAVRLMLERRVGGLPVLEGDRLVGVFTQVDALRGFLERLERP